MNNIITYVEGQSKEEDILEHLMACDDQFVPALSSKVILPTYAAKLYKNATCFEAWCNKMLIGLVAGYINQAEKFLYITNVSVLKEFQGKGVAGKLLISAIESGKKHQLNYIELEVTKSNLNAIHLYKKNNFSISKENDNAYFFVYKIIKDE